MLRYSEAQEGFVLRCGPLLRLMASRRERRNFTLKRVDVLGDWRDVLVLRLPLYVCLKSRRHITATLLSYLIHHVNDIGKIYFIKRGMQLFLTQGDVLINFISVVLCVNVCHTEVIYA